MIQYYKLQILPFTFYIILVKYFLLQKHNLQFLVYIFIKDLYFLLRFILFYDIIIIEFFVEKWRMKEEIK